LNHIKNNYDLTNRKKINVVFLNKENKPETLVVNTQMMKNYLKHVNDYGYGSGSQELPTSKGTHVTTVNKHDINLCGGNISNNHDYSLSFLIMQ